MIEKNKEYILHTIAQGYEGEGIAKINGTFPIFIEGALKGEEVRVRIVKVKKQYAYGKLLEIISSSKERQEEECTHYKRCGGCSMQHQSYEGQLNFKWERVKDCISKIGGINDNIVKFPIGMGENPYRYRNKVQLPIGMVNGELSIGFYAPRSHNIVNMESCIIQDEVGEHVAKITKEWAKENSIMPTTIDGEWYEQGLLRHIMIRKGFTTNEVMVVLITRDKKIPKLDQWIELVKSNVRGIKSIILNINPDKTNVIMGTECVTLWGDDVIQDYIGEFKYNISPLSFFQVNPKQTEKLYNETLKQAGLTGSEIVFDAYCGTGSITLFLSKNAKKVYGVEIIEPAIINARENAKLNNIENAEFFVGKSEEIIPDLINKNIVPDIVVVDPPRKGCDEVLLQAISNVLPKKIVYVSCDPTTLARDLRILENTGYKTETVQPVDMFPHTSHIENVALLVKERRDVEK